MNDDERVRDATTKVGLHHGRMISGSKSGYRRAYPDNAVVFNAALADPDGKDLWWGDLDLTVDEPKLLALAAELGTTIYVLYESDARLIGRSEPFRLDLAPAVVRVTPDGETIVGADTWRPQLERNAAGQLALVHHEMTLRIERVANAYILRDDSEAETFVVSEDNDVVVAWAMLPEDGEGADSRAPSSDRVGRWRGARGGPTREGIDACRSR